MTVHETQFARDSVFVYSHGYLRDCVEEKTGGRIRADQVECFLLDDVRGDSLTRLMALQGNVCCAVDGESQGDLNHFCSQLMAAAAQGKRFLFRSGASLLTALAQLPAQPVAAEAMHAYTRGGRAGAGRCIVEGFVDFDYDAGGAWSWEEAAGRPEDAARRY